MIEDDHEEGELICKCFAIDDLMIKRVVAANNLTTLEEVVNYTKAGGACTSCHEKIEWVLEECLAERAKAPASIAKTSSKPAVKPVEVAAAVPSPDVIALIEKIIEEVRPAVQADGGDISLVDVEESVVFVSLTGACTGCGLSGLTLANVENKINKALGDSYTVFPVQETAKKEGTYDV